ncbi:hypothetical protein CONLIGDRAFT_156882 [Coniochaeta ligniaria NRRL 30616]|uniref:Uncharacterized protein n=1 Tax=Coniochaeta ligniaria NRRL 30616 TaxID=1408157 RepID=A0A1J7J0C3_9PEZI|nr:hypothetical protein CONLIGDRAFT_156882 [Coniochaeta ligniaria NRRL 30616]
MVSRLFFTSLLLAGHLGLSQASPAFVGQGRIQVLKGDNITAARPSDRIGCMHETGAFTLSDCGVFTRVGNGLSSPLGNCTFNDDTQPANVDSIYGQRNYAWVCRNGVDNWLYYSFDINTNLTIIWHGNLDGYEDAKAVPKAGEKLPLWAFSWGSQQVDVPPGHVRTIWLWEPVTS